MLGRRQYRIKVLQGLYAYFQGSEQRLDVAGKNLLTSVEKFHELYYLFFSFIFEVAHFYEHRLEESRTKFFPTPEELNPSRKFLENRLLLQLRQNKDLADKISKYKFSWTEEQDMVRKVHQKLKTSKELEEYLASGQSSYKEDQEFFEKMFRKFIVKSTALQNYCEERNIFWYDDYDGAAVSVMKTLKLLSGSFGENDLLVNLLVKDTNEESKGDQKFILDLFRKTILHSETLNKLVESRTKNWELERIALTDIILIKMALVELIHFPQIPVKVTLNEYIEISKQFSSDKSKLFINGVLDKLTTDLMEEKKIKKSGRGLVT